MDLPLQRYRPLNPKFFFISFNYKESRIKFKLRWVGPYSLGVYRRNLRPEMERKAWVLSDCPAGHWSDLHHDHWGVPSLEGDMLDMHRPHGDRGWTPGLCERLPLLPLCQGARGGGQEGSGLAARRRV